jgi:hypothetical protein
MAPVSANPFAIEYVTLVAPYPPDECLRRIRDSIHSFFALPLSPTEMPLGGYIIAKRFTIFRHRAWTWNRGNLTIATGHARADPVRGTTINLRVSPPTVLYLWLVGVPLFLTLFACGSASNGSTSADAGFVTVFSLLFAAIYAVIVVQLWRQRGDRAFLVDTLARILNAQVNP